MSDSPNGDEFLLQAVGRGDLAAFSRIVERHQPWAWRVAYRYTGNEEDAADIVQEAFLRLLDGSGHSQDTSTPRAMTTVTTMIGFLPLELNLEEGGDMLQPMAVAAIGGLGMEMLVALFLMPCLYVIAAKRF
ncbi:MAG: efflux RND transporter permease subunit [Desulfuromonadales bacterium]|nr:efflux RND transporter permease subunit [Desulfuromonadales bacterium]